MALSRVNSAINRLVTIVPFHSVAANANERSCFESGKYSDLTIKSGPREFKVHKVVVCEQSEWFEKATKDNTFLVGIFVQD